MELELMLKVRYTGEATKQDVLDFISFETGATCSIDNDNPFMDEDSDINVEDIWIY